MMRKGFFGATDGRSLDWLRIPVFNREIPLDSQLFRNLQRGRGSICHQWRSSH